MILKESYKEFCTSSWNRKKRPRNQQQKVECYAEQAVRMIEDILTKNFVPQVEIEKNQYSKLKSFKASITLFQLIYSYEGSNQQQKVECYAEQAVRVTEDILTKNFVPQVEIEKNQYSKSNTVNALLVPALE